MSTQNSALQASAIAQALQATLNPHTSNEIRRQALEHLEGIKLQPEAPYYGYVLANDLQQAGSVRYFGLQLLEYGIKYRWSTYDDTQILQLRDWIVALAQATNSSDAPFFRNKIGQIWTECAKRCWAEQWLDMDRQLQELWHSPDADYQSTKQGLVLSIVESLAEDICSKDDAAAGLRVEVLGAALNEIVIPQGLYEAHVEARERASELRHGHEGWFARICTFASDCFKQIHIHGQAQAATFNNSAAKALSAMRSLVTWVSLKGVIEVRCIDCLFLAFHTQNVAIRSLAAESLYVIVSRPRGMHFLEQAEKIVGDVLQPDKLVLLAAAYQGQRFVPSDAEDLYLLQRRTSELVSALLDALLQYRQIEIQQDATIAFYELLLEALQNKSLLISIPVLHSLSKLLQTSDTRFRELNSKSMALLVDLCTERLLNYEMLSEDTEDITSQYLYQDFEIMPERHAFLGNYRRYCSSVLESIVREEPLDVIAHILDRAKVMLQQGPYSVSRGFDYKTYAKTSLPILQFDAQFVAAINAIKGYASGGSETYGSAVDKVLQQWCLDVADLHVDDPEIASHVLSIYSNVLRSTSAGKSIFLPIMQHLLTIHLESHPDNNAYTDSLKGFEALRVLEVQKIALLFSDELFQYYDDLEQKVTELIATHHDDERVVWGFKAFLFIIVQRTSTKYLDERSRAERLQRMISPVLKAWSELADTRAGDTLEMFCYSLGLADLPDFYERKQFHNEKDWAQRELDEEGQARQADLKQRAERLPLRMTKALLAATTEKLRDDSSTHDMACELWQSSIELVLPMLLKMIRHAQAFSNPHNWAHLTPQLQDVFQRTLQDRFWQSGISNESRDEFYARITGSKTSFEGFASTVRGTMRNIREQGYHIIFLMTKFEEQVYGIPELPQALASALFDDATSLSAHHLQPLINLATGLVQRCPPHHRVRFLPPLLSHMFRNMDRKLTREWQSVISINEQSREEDDLSEEMRAESVLRQLSYSMVTFVAFLLEAEKQITPSSEEGKPRVGEVVLSEISILEPMLMFCTHALRMRDTRSCSFVCRLLIDLIPRLDKDIGPAIEAREFVSEEVLQASITSFNEPYFTDMQRDLVALIAQIVVHYCSKTTKPRSVFLSLPNMAESKVDKALDKLVRTKTARGQRSVMQDLLEGVRGVSIHESGKISRSDTNRKDKVQSQYMEVEKKPTIVSGGEEGLDLISGLFGDE